MNTNLTIYYHTIIQQKSQVKINYCIKKALDEFLRKTHQGTNKSNKEDTILFDTKNIYKIQYRTTVSVTEKNKPRNSTTRPATYKQP